MNSIHHDNRIIVISGNETEWNASRTVRGSFDTSIYVNKNATNCITLWLKICITSQFMTLSDFQSVSYKKYTPGQK